MEFTDEQAYARSTEAARAQLRASLRYPPPGFVAGVARSEQTEEVSLGEEDDATYYELHIPVLPGVHAAGIYLRPKRSTAPPFPSTKLSLIIAAAGRGGLPEPGPDGKLPILQHSNRDLALGAVRRGYAVWMPTYVFYGQDRPTDLRERLTVRAWEAGTSLPAVEIAKTIGALEALLRRPEIDPERVAMVGLSYGGFYTLYTAALEPRIRVAVVSAYFNDREAILDNSEPSGFLDWRFPDSLSLWRDPVVAALVCPRPLLVQAGNRDQLFPIEGARHTAPLAAAFYERLGVGDRFRFQEFTGRHDFDGEAAWDFIDSAFGRRAEGSE